MNEFIAPLLFAAIFSAGDNLHTRNTKDSHATAPPEQTEVLALPSLYRSVESSGELRRGER